MMNNKTSELESEKNAGGIQVIARAAAILRVLAGNPHGLSLASIAQQVELPRSTVHRIIQALEVEHMVSLHSSKNGYCIGPAFGQLITQTQTDIISLVKPHVANLVEEVNETVCLSYLVEDKVYVVDRVVAEQPLQVVFPLGVNAPAAVIAGGKVLLARLSSEALSKTLPDVLEKHTKFSLDKRSLLTQLQEIRVSEFASDFDEFIEGLCTFAVPLDTYLGNYSIAVVAPSTRGRINAESIRVALDKCRESIQREIGKTLVKK
jgi:DNA-binding IclR family transcriptional regulator